MRLCDSLVGSILRTNSLENHESFSLRGLVDANELKRTNERNSGMEREITNEKIN